MPLNSLFRSRPFKGFNIASISECSFPLNISSFSHFHPSFDTLFSHKILGFAFVVMGAVYVPFQTFTMSTELGGIYVFMGTAKIIDPFEFKLESLHWWMREENWTDEEIKGLTLRGLNGRVSEESQEGMESMNVALEVLEYFLWRVSRGNGKVDEKDVKPAGCLWMKSLKREWKVAEPLRLGKLLPVLKSLKREWKDNVKSFEDLFYRLEESQEGMERG